MYNIPGMIDLVIDLVPSRLVPRYIDHNNNAIHLLHRPTFLTN